MLPIGPLMIEHRLIERMIDLARREADRIENGGPIDTDFIRDMVDFMRTYADRTHHGKEEDILFRELRERDLSDDDMALMKELEEEHVRARALVGALEGAGLGAESSPGGSGDEIIRTLREIVALYPQHITKEDERFFPASMGYFSDEEKDTMLATFREFDREMIHERYRATVEGIERTRPARKTERSAQ
ncbi:MAG: cation-binding protein [Candidatus Eisenbacteria bacterium]|nr:cation-binding protein [Candidatus Eisenbacteria bacterium]